MNQIDSDDKELKLDPSVLAGLPQGSRVISTARHGLSFWTNTGRINVELENRTAQSFFVKIVHNKDGLRMVHGEYESMKAIHTVLPEFAPKPVSYGAYKTNPNTYFFLCEYIEMTGEMPEPDVFGSRLAALHKQSISPTGKFGFHLPTYSGNVPQKNEWEDRWEDFFARNMRWALECEMKAKGTTDPQFDILVPVIFDKVIPRLLRPLESEGRSVKPSLVHGDLWYANSGVDVRTHMPLIFDACCLFAHNEYEFGQWMPTCNRFGPEYRAAYHAHNKISEPKEDYGGRLDLYKLRFNTHVSALFPDNLAMREQMLNDMKSLVQRYG